MQRNVGCAPSSVEAKAEFPWNGLLYVGKQVAVESVIAGIECLTLVVSVASACVDRNTGSASWIPVHPQGKAGLLTFPYIPIRVFLYSIVHERVGFDAIVGEGISEIGVQVKFGTETVVCQSEYMSFSVSRSGFP